MSRFEKYKLLTEDELNALVRPGWKQLAIVVGGAVAGIVLSAVLIAAVLAWA